MHTKLFSGEQEWALRNRFPNIRKIGVPGGLERRRLNTHGPSLHVEWNSLMKKITSPTAKKALSAGEIINCESDPCDHSELTSTCRSEPSLLQSEQHPHTSWNRPTSNDLGYGIICYSKSCLTSRL